jgi:hypothetical protein
MSQPEPLDLVPVLEADGTPLELSEMEAAGLQSLLAANGIEAFVNGAEMMPNLPYRLEVPSGQAKQAAEVIAEARSAGAAGADEAELAGESAPGE